MRANAGTVAAMGRPNARGDETTLLAADTSKPDRSQALRAISAATCRAASSVAATSARVCAVDTNRFS